MDLGGDFCLVCGADPPLFSGRMCEKCTRDRVTLVKVPKNVPWTKCARCGIIDFQGKWTAVEDEDLWHELVQRNVEFHAEVEDLELGLMAQEVDGRHTLIHLEIEGVIDDLLYTEKHTMRARMSNGVCLTCTRRAGNYFEATVQLRSSARRLSEEEFMTLRTTLDDVLAEMPEDPMFFITNEGPVTGLIASLIRSLLDPCMACRYVCQVSQLGSPCDKTVVVPLPSMCSSGSIPANQPTGDG